MSPSPTHNDGIQMAYTNDSINSQQSHYLEIPALDRSQLTSSPPKSKSDDNRQQRSLSPDISGNKDLVFLSPIRDKEAPPKGITPSSTRATPGLDFASEYESNLADTESEYIPDNDADSEFEPKTGLTPKTKRQSSPSARNTHELKTAATTTTSMASTNVRLTRRMSQRLNQVKVTRKENQLDTSQPIGTLDESKSGKNKSNQMEPAPRTSDGQNTLPSKPTNPATKNEQAGEEELTIPETQPEEMEYNNDTGRERAGKNASQSESSSYSDDSQPTKETESAIIVTATTEAIKDTTDEMDVEVNDKSSNMDVESKAADKSGSEADYTSSEESDSGESTSLSTSDGEGEKVDVDLIDKPNNEEVSEGKSLEQNTNKDEHKEDSSSGSESKPGSESKSRDDRAERNLLEGQIIDTVTEASNGNEVEVRKQRERKWWW